LVISLLLLGQWVVLAVTLHVTWLHGVFALPACVAVLSLCLPEQSGLRIVAVALGLSAVAWWAMYAFGVRPYAFAWGQLVPLAISVGHLISIAGIVYTKRIAPQG
jgi:hypothetical protein